LASVIFRGRRVKVQIGTLLIETPATGDGLNVEIDVVRTLDRLPNTATVKIYNMTEMHRRQCEALTGDDRIALEIGYVTTGLFEIFRGEVRLAQTARQDADLVTTIEAADGHKAINARINRSYARGTKLSVVLRDLQQLSGMGPGNLDEMLAREPRLANAKLETGITLRGEAGKLIQEALGPQGFTGSVQAGVMQVTGTGGLPATAVLLKPGTGLLGSPSLALDQDGKTRILSAEARPQPGLEPGRQVRVEAESVTGTFVVQRSQYAGSVNGEQWTAAIEARPY